VNVFDEVEELHAVEGAEQSLHQLEEQARLTR
jgi:hypothetical protein